MSKKPFKVIARHPPDHPPLAALALSALPPPPHPKVTWQKSKNLEKAELRFTTGEVLEGDLLAARYFARASVPLPLYGEDALTATEIDCWVDYAGGELKAACQDDDKLVAQLDELNTHFRLRTYLVGHDLTLADAVLWATLALSPAWAGILSSNKKIKYKHVVRWWGALEALPAFQEARAAITKEIKEEGPHVHGTFGELVGGEYGKVVVRFPPEPSGFLHVGHAKAAFLNQLYAQKYGGKLIVRFDDTNPRKEKEEFEEAILEDLATMGIKPDLTSHTSDHFQLILDKATELIKVGKAFCDDSTAEEIEKQREELRPSPHRNDSVEFTLQMWAEMQKGSEIGKKFALRAKIVYDHPNGTMRDPVIYRYVDMPHNRTGRKFNVYPIYNFSCPIVDSHEGVTHALRSNEYHDSEVQYAWFLENVPGLRHVTIKDFGRVNFTYTLLSKRKLQWFVDQGIVPGWDDPRFPTVQGMTRRGLTMDALRQFIFDQGDSKKPVNLDILRLWAFNKKVIDRIIPRYTAVSKEHPVLLTLDGPAAPEKVELPRHKQNDSLGKKTVVRASKVFIEQEDAKLLKPDMEITLMDWGNVIVTKIDTDSAGIVTAVQAKLHLAGDPKKTDYKLTWLAATEDLPTIKLIEFDTIITEKSVPKDAPIEKYVNLNSRAETLAYADPNVLTQLKKGDKLQFERVGYFQLDQLPAEGRPAEFVLIPDGHEKNVWLSKKVVVKT